jgi:predicted N-acetyltransferase YhbS
MKLETIDQRTITEADARAIATLLVSIWPKPHRTVDTRTAEIFAQWKNYTGPASQYPRSFLFRENGQVVAHAQADPRTIHTSAGDITILALCRVCTDPAVRGKKLGQAVVEAAFELVDKGNYPFSLFQTTNEVRSFYEKLGSVAVNNRLFNSRATDPTANPFWDSVIMRYPATGSWPAGDIDTNGPGW